MLSFFISLIISVMLAFGMAIALVEKGDDFPIKFWKSKLQTILGKIHPRLPEMLECTTCTSFWACFFSDAVLCIINWVLFLSSSEKIIAFVFVSAGTGVKEISLRTLRLRTVSGPIKVLPLTFTLLSLE